MPSKPASSLSLDDLRRAVSLMERIAALERELSTIIGSNGTRPRGMKRSAAARSRKGAGRKARRAKRVEKTTSKSPVKRRRRMSAAARARIAAAARARWAKAKAAGKKTLGS